jgi:hypothetical protein
VIEVLRDSIAEAAEFAVDAPVARGRVLRVQTRHETAELSRSRRMVAWRREPPEVPWTMISAAVDFVRQLFARSPSPGIRLRTT